MFAQSPFTQLATEFRGISKKIKAPEQNSSSGINRILFHTIPSCIFPLNTNTLNVNYESLKKPFLQGPKRAGYKVYINKNLAHHIVMAILHVMLLTKSSKEVGIVSFYSFGWKHVTCDKLSCSVKQTSRPGSLVRETSFNNILATRTTPRAVF